MIAVRFFATAPTTVHRPMALDPLISPMLEGLPDLLVLIRRDGVLLGHVGGRGVAPLQPAAVSIGQAIESIWPENVTRVIRQLVRQALSSRTTRDTVFSDGDQAYEARACPQGPDRALCVIRQPSTSAEEPSGATGRYDAVAANFERRNFLRRLQESLSSATLREQATAVAVIHVDGIQDLARIMDTQIAEQTLSAAIGRLEQHRIEASEQEFPYYIGQLSENQIVLVIESRDRDCLEALVERHCNSLREPIRMGDAEFHLVPFAGVAILGPDAPSPRRLLKNARGAAAEARRSGTRRACFFSDTVRLRSLARMDIAQELRSAIADRAIKLRYMARRDLGTGRLIAAVGYMRWIHPLRGEVPPSEFLAVAETTGLATALSRNVLQCVSDDYAALRAHGDPDIAVSFGPLRQHILDDGFLDDIARVLAGGALRPERLELRIDERSLCACDAALLPGIASLGVKLIVDEIGRGLSSFDFLARAPLAGLQLDRSWVLGLPGDEVALKMCRAGFGIAQALGLESLARGVDGAGQRDALAALGCRQGIGDLYGEIEVANPLSEPAPRARRAGH